MRKDANPIVPRRTCTAFVIVSIALATSAHAATLDVPAQRALLDKYCLGCHNQKLKTAGISIEGGDLGQPASHADLWERVIRKVRSGQMPPPGLPHPDSPTDAAFANSLEASHDQDAAAAPDHGRQN